MYSNPADAKTIRCNLSMNEVQRAKFKEAAKKERKQFTPLVLEYAEIAYELIHGHGGDLADIAKKLRRANA